MNQISEYWNKRRRLGELQSKLREICLPYDLELERIRKTRDNNTEHISQEIKILQTTISDTEKDMIAWIPEGQKQVVLGKTHVDNDELFSTRISLKTTYTTVVKDKAKLVLLLQRIDKIEEGCKDFYLSFIKKLFSAGIIEEDVVEMVPKVNIYVEELDG